MFNRFMKITGTNGEQRWVNLDRVTRVSLAKDTSGDEILVFCFDGQDHVKLHGNDDSNRELIHRITSSLNAVADTPGRLRAA
jgi:hypothetical protein